MTESHAVVALHARMRVLLIRLSIVEYFSASDEDMAPVQVKVEEMADQFGIMQCCPWKDEDVQYGFECMLEGFGPVLYSCTAIPTSQESSVQWLTSRSYVGLGLGLGDRYPRHHHARTGDRDCSTW